MSIQEDPYGNKFSQHTVKGPEEFEAELPKIMKAAGYTSKSDFFVAAARQFVPNKMGFATPGAVEKLISAGVMDILEKPLFHDFSAQLESAEFVKIAVDNLSTWMSAHYHGFALRHRVEQKGFTHITLLESDVLPNSPGKGYSVSPDCRAAISEIAERHRRLRLEEIETFLTVSVGVHSPLRFYFEADGLAWVGLTVFQGDIAFQFQLSLDETIYMHRPPRGMHSLLQVGQENRLAAILAGKPLPWIHQPSY